MSPTKFEVDMTMRCRVIAFLSADTARDLVTLTFDLEQLSHTAGHVINPATEFEDATTIRSCVTNYNVSHCLPLKMRKRHCACAESRDLCVEGQKQLHFWNPRPWFAYSLCNFYWAMTTIKGSLLSSRSMLKPFLDEKNSKSRRNVAHAWRFFWENGGGNVSFWVCDPQKSLPCAEPRRLTYFASKSVHASRL